MGYTRPRGLPRISRVRPGLTSGSVEVNRSIACTVEILGVREREKKKGGCPNGNEGGWEPTQSCFTAPVPLPEAPASHTHRGVLMSGLKTCCCGSVHTRYDALRVNDNVSSVFLLLFFCRRRR